MYKNLSVCLQFNEHVKFSDTEDYAAFFQGESSTVKNTHVRFYAVYHRSSCCLSFRSEAGHRKCVCAENPSKETTQNKTKSSVCRRKACRNYLKREEEEPIWVKWYTQVGCIKASSRGGLLTAVRCPPTVVSQTDSVGASR